MRLGLYNDSGFDPTVSPCLGLTACIYGFCTGETIYFMIILNDVLIAAFFFFVVVVCLFFPPTIVMLRNIHFRAPRFENAMS